MTTPTPPANRRLQAETGRPIVLGEKLGEGGEGIVYRMQDQPNSVAKIWHPDKKPPDADAKLAYLVNHPVQPELGAVWRITWPQHLVKKEDGGLVGYTMPELDRSSWQPIVKYYNLKAAEVTEADQGRELRIDDRVRMATNIALGFQAVHAAGYIIGDVNEKNIEVNRQNDIAMVGCDSYGFTDSATERTFSNNMGRPEFQAPEAQGDYTNRNQDHDRFGLAVIIFLLLTGYHPHTITGQHAQDYNTHGARISNWLFPPADRSVPTTDEYRMAWNRLALRQKELFMRCFSWAYTGGPRPTPVEWLEALQEHPKERPSTPSPPPRQQQPPPPRQQQLPPQPRYPNPQTPQPDPLPPAPLELGKRAMLVAGTIVTFVALPVLIWLYWGSGNDPPKIVASEVSNTGAELDAMVVAPVATPVPTPVPTPTLISTDTPAPPTPTVVLANVPILLRNDTPTPASPTLSDEREQQIILNAFAECNSQYSGEAKRHRYAAAASSIKRELHTIATIRAQVEERCGGVFPELTVTSSQLTGASAPAPMPTATPLPVSTPTPMQWLIQNPAHPEISGASRDTHVLLQGCYLGDQISARKFRLASWDVWDPSRYGSDLKFVNLITNTGAKLPLEPGACYEARAVKHVNTAEEYVCLDQGSTHSQQMHCDNYSENEVLPTFILHPDSADDPDNYSQSFEMIRPPQ